MNAKQCNDDQACTTHPHIFVNLILYHIVVILMVLSSYQHYHLKHMQHQDKINDMYT